MADREFRTGWIVLIMLTFVTDTSQNTRQKRQISPQQPKIITTNGHLVFETGINHNITFKSTAGGYVNVNGENLVSMVQTVKSNKQAIDELRAFPTEIPSNIEGRLTSVEQRLNNLQPTGAVQSQLISIESRLNTLETANLVTRLDAIEQQITGFQSLSWSVTNLTSQMSSLQRNVSKDTLTSQVSSLQQTVSKDTLTSQVSSLQRNVSKDTLTSQVSLLQRNVSKDSLTSQVSSLQQTVSKHTLTSQVPSLQRNVDGLQAQVTEATSNGIAVSELEEQLLTQNECSSNPCSNGGTCIDRYNAYSCRCLPAWKGVNCNEDVNECYEYAGTDRGCQNGATCVNTRGSFTCQCTTNYHGIRCTETHDDCTGASAQELCGHGTCINTDRVLPGQPKYHCICEDGWTKSGSDPACNTDVNECDSTQPAVCSVDPLVPCINVPGTFYCGQCPTGYSGNGFNCADINECATSNGGCSLSPRVDCINTRGSRTCGPCPSGYQGNGETCNWVGVCSTNNGGCHPQASCQESPGVLTCTCSPGYVGNGIGPNGCVSQGPVTGPCASNPCRNGAACQTNGNTFVCVCIPGYEGIQCETNTNECASNPCQNGGTCVDQVNGYSCQCDSAYSGNNCQDEQQACGGHLTGETGTITYPATPGTTYPHGLSCAYRITTTPGLIVSLTFTSFNVEAHTTCGYDFLQINDGPTAASYALGRYCGSTLPNNGQPINTTQHQMYLWFFTDASVTDEGFSATWISVPPVCGGRLANQTHGSINSPGYPGNYPHDSTCSWEVSVPPGNNIMFTFAALAMESHPNCSYDYLEIRDGPFPTSQILQRYCNTSQPPPLSTTGPNAFVKFHSDSMLTDRGFHITYVAISAGDQCGGQLTGETGVITSPNYPNYYDHNGYCAWTITVSTGDSITLTFTDMALEHGGCSFDYVEVRDGSDENSRLFSRYCGTSIPSPLTSSGNVMFIEFRTDGSIHNRGFRVEWTTACGGLFTALQGSLQSPYYPNAYPENKECVYSIDQPYGNIVTLTFSAFDVEGISGTTCLFDYVEIRDGTSDTSPLLGHFCGSDIPDPVTTTQSSMRVKFVTDSSVQNLGFLASYVSYVAPCGGELTDHSGSIQSPGHPNTYPHGANCTWRIIVSPGFIIRLSFNSFTLEGSSSATCYFDYVDVYDNSSAIESSRIGRYCGRMTPPSVTSTSNVMTITFSADSSIAHEGFTASYVTLNASTVCGRSLTTSTGVITSPNFPDNYPHQRDCIWTIVAPSNIQILLNVTDFQLESHTNCMFDFLEIRNGGFDDSPLVNRYCGNTIDTIIRSHSNRMWLKFQSDSSLSARGFRIVYEATATGCGGDLTTPTGSFVSPDYPSNYPHNAECFWTITVSHGSQIILNVTDIDMEGSSSDCYFDYILIRDGSASGRQLGKFCGSTLPNVTRSPSNVLWIKYKTDFSVTGRGFYISYFTVCNSRLTSFSGVIESPNFPEPYPHNRNCTWIIETSLGNTVNAAFSHFDVETHHSCSWDYLQIRDGELITSPSLGKFCGTNLPDPVNSTSNKMLVQFMSDFSLANNGFRLEYVTNGCGGYLVTQTGSFASPNYPNNYPHLRVCEWSINVASGTKIELTLDDFNFEPHASCGFDGLEIYGGMDSASPLLATLCHTQTEPQVFTATGNQMFLRFRSDFYVSGRGFHATYRSLPGGCGGNFSTPMGTLTSANYPNNYPHNTECVWLITVVPSKNIQLTFNDFILEGGSNCNFDYVKVFDGPTIHNTMLMSHCGSSLPSPPTYRSSGNQMLLRMRTDSSVSRKGFNATYVTGCGGTLTAEQDGEIVSTNYPGIYDPLSNCSWLILADHSADRITLTFTHMDTEFYSSCIHDYVSVYNGDDEAAPLIGKYCGNTIPSPITSLGSALFVRFVTDISVQRTGFRAVYSKSSSACGGDFTAERGSFLSPGYPSMYPPSTECVWTFTVSPGNRVMVSFSTFTLEDSPSCNFDYLELREGDVNGNLIGRYCGTNIPSNLTSYQGLWMKFRSDETPGPNSVGFLGQYGSVFGGEITGSSGQVASPLYPSQYPHNSDYTWTITVDTNMRIRVAFTAMDLEFRQTGCIYDYLLFRDGGSADSPEIGRYCGLTIPEPVLTTTNQLRVEFHTDFSASGQGFLFDWQATNEMAPTTLPPGVSTTPTPGCGGTHDIFPYQITTIISPGYPNGYADNLDCVWNLNAAPGSIVWFNVTDINLENHPSCGYDSLFVNDVNGNYGPLLGRFCGRVPNDQPILSTTPHMTLRFQTDYSVNKTGFSVNLQAVCGGILRMPTGVIRSPFYPNSYPNNVNCSWYVRVDVGRTIRVEFIGGFNVLGSGEACQGDSVQLLGGPSLSSPPIGSSLTGRYCGSQLPQAMNTSSNYLTVNFVSDRSMVGTGFQLEFTEVSVTCGDTLFLTDGVTSGYFTSPNYPAVYPHNVDCVWVITAPASRSIQIDFIDSFNIQDHNQCQYNYVEVRDGGTINSPVLAHLCGNTLPSTVMSTANVMFVRFRTHLGVAQSGFKAMYKIGDCGGRVYGMSGSITSPNYPTNYPSNSHCVWDIEAPTGHYITFTITNFNLEYSYNCDTDDVDFLEIRDINATGPVLLRSCGQSPPSSIDTSDSFALVTFRSNSAYNAAGFLINFQASVEVCGGEMTSPTGSFTSPNFPGQYPHSRVCTWLITVQQGRRVSLTFDNFNLEGDLVCRFDYVAVYNGIMADSPRMTTLCGETIPQLQESSGNTMKVVFRTDGSVSNGGFRASYTSNNEQVCGGLLTNNPGTISSPGYETGSNYTNNLQCVWVIANLNISDTSMALSFQNIQLESHQNCVYDFLEVREGNSAESPLIGKYCGKTYMPGPIFSPSPYLWVRFKTDTSIVDHGFSLNYGFTDCGGILTQDNGVITSPNYPNLYNHSDSCAWIIQAPEGVRVNVQFTNFDIENHSSCVFDYLEILNGPYGDSPSVGKFCGTTMPPSFTSQYNAIRVYFKTDISISNQGFRLTYFFQSGGCGGLYHSNDGQIMSPNYPQSYPHRTECVWDINVSPGYHVSLTFNPPFDLESHASCTWDYVEVNDGLWNGTLAPLGRWCSNLTPPPQSSTTDRLVVKFRSNINTNGNGFSANWTVGCGSVFTEPNGRIVSPGYPGNYDNNLLCNYTINTDPQRFIVAIFSTFDLEGGYSCPYDYLEAFSGNSSSGRRRGRFCGSTIPQAFSSLGSMFLRFRTDATVVSRGFVLNYQTSECGGNFTNSYGFISTPQEPSEYHHNANCSWLITVATDRVVYLKFTMFDLEAHPSCAYDYVDVRDGADLSSPLIGRYCGNVVPDMIRAQSNTLLVNFISDYSMAGKGFTAFYSSGFGVAQGCGGVLNSTSGSFRSTDIDGDGLYENGQDCVWTIIVGNNQLVVLTIASVHIERQSSCYFDGIKIFDGMDTTDPLIGTYCGTNAPGVVRSTSNVLTVRFYTDGSITDMGFNATYTQETSVCGGAVISTNNPQTITSPSGAQFPPSQPVQCRWIVDAPNSNQRVRFTMTTMNLDSHANCSNEFVEFRDSPLRYGGRSMHYCGSTLPSMFESIGQTAQINYKASGTSAGHGFSLTYQTATCNRTYSDYSGQIHSPGWPGNYPSNIYCEILINGPPNTWITLYFNIFSIESHRSCRFDYLQVRNGSTATAPTVATLCGYAIPDPIFGSGNSLWLGFRTDGSLTHPGFDITYTASTTGMGCGGNITGINGSLTSPGYPGNYTERHSCRWLITVPGRRVVRATFTDLNLIGSPDCNRDSVAVYNGNSEQQPIFGRYCGNETPATLVASGNVMLVKFTTDGVGSAPGFRMTFTS
ncbi:cubilin-like [Ylistrum balloti]|uniref:cubilin-like n=1 Tax=Ylistrum balloti TaxID=509963 RepID=UPI002905AFA4|nr:cubilin-like [Ylistrum balloti]